MAAARQRRGYTTALSAYRAILYKHEKNPWWNIFTSSRNGLGIILTRCN